jgi:hypothetical protein
VAVGAGMGGDMFRMAITGARIGAHMNNADRGAAALARVKPLPALGASSVQTESFGRIKMLKKQKAGACAVSRGERNRLQRPRR